MRRIQSDLQRETNEVEVTMRSRTAVESAFIKFRGLLHELNISPNRDEVLAVKIDLDTNPSAGANMETRVIRRFVMLNLQYYDRASLLAGKLHAILTRRYTKGRDLYDLSWYLADPSWPPPNFALLNNALLQSGFNGPLLTRENWREIIRKQLLDVDWEVAVQDVSPFLDRKQDVAFVSKESLFPLLELG